MKDAIDYLTKRLKEKEEMLSGKTKTFQEKSEIRFQMDCIQAAINEIHLEESAVA